MKSSFKKSKGKSQKIEGGMGVNDLDVMFFGQAGNIVVFKTQQWYFHPPIIHSITSSTSTHNHIIICPHRAQWMKSISPTTQLKQQKNETKNTIAWRYQKMDITVGVKSAKKYINLGKGQKYQNINILEYGYQINQQQVLKELIKIYQKMITCPQDTNPFKLYFILPSQSLSVQFIKSIKLLIRCNNCIGYIFFDILPKGSEEKLLLYSNLFFQVCKSTPGYEHFMFIMMCIRQRRLGVIDYENHGKLCCGMYINNQKIMRVQPLYQNSVGGSIDYIQKQSKMDF